MIGREILETVIVGLLTGVFVSYITGESFLVPVMVSISTCALVKSMFSKSRYEALCRIEESALEPILYRLSDRLRLGLSPEKAFHLSIDPTSRNPIIIRRTIRAIENGQPLSETLKSLSTEIGSEGERRTLSFARESLPKDSRRAGTSLRESLNRIRKNRELVSERSMTIRSLLFRVKVLSATCSTTLALIVALLPMLRWITITQDWPQMATMGEQHSTWTAAIVLSLTSGISSYSAADIALARRPFLYATSSFLIFWTVFLLASQLL